ncbi:fatty acid desaturase [Paenibacillus sp. LMG 31456]|uniref:Fatty acid desaturase n=1 Tax=Paenibacillus foliorum TaxID=2654974 RepID=A0A972JZ80_9BACL|nr:fatty acid desaturase [Paenibacillus foliorum]NOU92470.1 fatty acid desaturase [Paenibacillus foliorum]
MSSSNHQAQLRKNVAPYEKSITKSSVRQILNTIPPLILLWVAAYLSLSVSYWLSLAFSIIASGFVIRTFIIFHDCCHQSFFKNRLANEILGTVTGVITMFPYHQWKNAHSIHHATSSNLDKRGIGDIWMLTVDEYIALPLWSRIAYRLYRNPLSMIIVGPIYTFLIAQRFNVKGARRPERINTWITNICIVALYSLLCWAIGWQTFLLIQGPIFWISGALGIWLFYVQHQFEDSYFENEEEWSYVKAAVEGSSYYKLPKVLQWITGNIGFHHVHHLNPRVPNYHLEEAHNAVPPLQQVTTITIATSLKSLQFRLWDEENKAFVGFKEIRHLLLKPKPLTAGTKKSA